MGRSGRRDDFVSVIPDDLKLFDAVDVRKAFEYLEKTFHLHHDWQACFRTEFLTEPRSISEQEFFFRYCLKNIDPPLKQILRRNESVILSMCRYLIRDKIKAKKQEENQMKNYYSNGNGRKQTG